MSGLSDLRSIAKTESKETPCISSVWHTAKASWSLNTLHKRIVRRIVDGDSVAAADNYRHAYSSWPVPYGFFKLLFQRVRMVGCGLMPWKICRTDR